MYLTKFFFEEYDRFDTLITIIFVQLLESVALTKINIGKLQNYIFFM